MIAAVRRVALDRFTAARAQAGSAIAAARLSSMTTQGGRRLIGASVPLSIASRSAAAAITAHRSSSHVPARLFSTRPGAAAASSASAPLAPEAALLSALSSLPAGSFVLGYLAQSGQLSPMLDEIEAQENAPTGLRANVIGLHGNLVLVQFGRQKAAAHDAAAPTVDPIPPRMAHPLHAATIWFSPAIASFRSISHASEILRGALRSTAGGSKGVKFSSYSFDELPLARRSSLILESLPRSKIFSDPDTRHSFPLQLSPLQGAGTISSKRMMQMDEHGEMQPVLQSSSALQPSSATQPLPPLAAFTLLSSSQMLYAPRTSSALPNGALSFQWDRTGPPSRAYLKLWEALSRVQIGMLQDLGVQAGTARWDQIKPQKNSLVLDLGASPGGWTWALAQMGCTVLSVDRAELSLSVARLPNVHHHLGSGFSVDPDAEMLQPFLDKREKQHRKAASKARSKKERALLHQSSEADEYEHEEEDEYAEQAAQMRDAEAAQESPIIPSESSPFPASAIVPRRVDWLFSDIVCYPDRSLALIEKWLKADAVECGIVVTIKMQSDPAATAEPTPPGFIGSGSEPTKGAVQRHHLAAWPEVLARLRAIPDSSLTHLQENKNELTFVWIRPDKKDEFQA